jgi:hypothetical protein
MSEYRGVPEGMDVQGVIIERVLKSTGAVLEVCLVKHGRQYEAALFMDKRFKPGPPLPRPLETPSGESTHWMGVRPKVGLSQEEAEQIESEVLGTNTLHRIPMKDEWGNLADSL